MASEAGMTAARSSRNNNGANSNSHRVSIPCRYFLNGICRDGPRCRFSHDRSVDRSNINLCKYYLRGECAYGESCKYEHVRPISTNQRGTSARGASSSARDTDKSTVENLSDILSKTKLRPDAQEFVPSWLASANEESSATIDESDSKDIFCPYHILGQCWYGDRCPLLHGTMCDLCDRHLLHPTDNEANRKHRIECLAEHEREMKAAFAVARTKEKQCGICMEVVLEKAKPSARRFGILPSCRHSFCLDCIRKWRQTKTLENKVIRACPECRTVSDFIAPSTVWVEEEEEKRSLIETYKSEMKKKVCKYFREESKVECPFGNKCFYRHVKPDGTVVPGDSPRTIRRRQRQRQRREGGANGSGRAASADLYLLWEFLEENDWRRSHMSSDDWPWEFQMEDEFDWMSLTDSESDYYDY